MSRIKSWWKPMMVGALLMATLVGAAGARRGREANVSATKTVTMGAHDCIRGMRMTRTCATSDGCNATMAAASSCAQ